MKALLSRLGRSAKAKSSQHRPRVVVATRIYPPEVGAAAFRLQALVSGLLDSGAEVKVLTTKPPGGTVPPGERVRASRWPVLRDSGGNVRGYVQYLSFDVPLFFRLLFCRADVVVAEPPPTTGFVVALTSLIRGRPFVYYAADVWTEAAASTTAPKAVVALLRVLEGTVLRNAARVIAVSGGVAESIRQFGVEPGKVSVVGNGVDTAVFVHGGAVMDVGAPYFVYAGTMSEWQGADIFVRALPAVLRKYPQAQIRFLGQGSDEERLKQLARQTAPANVHFGGVVPPLETAAWIRGAQAALVSIVPGLGYDFAKPTKIYAAAACGTQIIFAGPVDGDGARVIVEGRLGTVTAYSEGDVSAAMLTALENRDEQGSERAQWVHENASLRRTGQLAAGEVLSLYPRSVSVQ